MSKGVSELRIAVLGAGLMGRFHAETIRRTPGAKLEAVVDVDERTARSVAEDLGCERVYTSAEPVLESDDIGAVVIVAPAASHHRLILDAVAAGKAIFCEKPLSVTLQQAAEVVAAVESGGIPFQIGFQRRFDEGVAKLVRLARDGELGELETFRSVTGDPAGPDFEAMKRVAGIFHDTLSHDMDMALLFFGPIEQVQAWGDAGIDERFLELGKPDTTAILLRFESGRLGVIENRLRTGFGYETVLEVGGSKRKGVVRNDLADDLAVYGESGIVHSHVNWFLERYRDAYRSEMLQFVSAVLKGQRPEPGVRQGLEVQIACLAAERSFLQERPVALQELRAEAEA